MKKQKIKKNLFKSSRVAQSKMYTRSKFGNSFYGIFFFLLGCFSILPLVYSLATSLKPLDELMVFPPKFFVKRPTFQNFLVLPSLLSNLSVPLSRYIFNSAFVSIITTVLQIITSSMAAFTLAKSNIRGKKVIFTIVQYALLFNTYTLAIPQYLIFSYFKMVDTYSVYIFPALASTMSVFLMKQYMETSIPDALLEAATIDGAGTFYTFFKIVMPLVKPCIMTLCLFGFSAMWSANNSSMIFTESIKTLPMIVSQITEGGIARAGSAMAISVIMMLPPILVYFITQSNVLESMNSAGIKE